ncbi:MAG TPA: hypothetical protein V6C65_24300 [Allocoleopsis sp.]
MTQNKRTRSPLEVIERLLAELTPQEFMQVVLVVAAQNGGEVKIRFPQNAQGPGGIVYSLATPDEALIDRVIQAIDEAKTTP